MSCTISVERTKISTLAIVSTNYDAMMSRRVLTNLDPVMTDFRLALNGTMRFF